MPIPEGVDRSEEVIFAQGNSVKIPHFREQNWGQ